MWTESQCTRFNKNLKKQRTLTSFNRRIICICMLVCMCVKTWLILHRLKWVCVCWTERKEWMNPCMSLCVLMCLNGNFPSLHTNNIICNRKPWMERKIDGCLPAVAQKYNNTLYWNTHCYISVQVGDIFRHHMHGHKEHNLKNCVKCVQRVHRISEDQFKQVMKQLHNHFCHTIE